MHPGASRAELWSLSLGETSTWQRVVTEEPEPGAELANGRLIIHDRTVLALGAGGTWSLDSLLPQGYAPGPTIERSLGARATWQPLSVGDAPVG